MLDAWSSKLYTSLGTVPRGIDMTTAEKARVAVLKVEQRALELGYVVSIPTTEVVYDLVIEKGGKFQRIQVKYGDGKSSRSAGAVVIDTRHRTGNSQGRWTSYDDGVDALLAYVPKTDTVLWFGRDKFVGKQGLTIRLEPPKNNQKKGLLLARELKW